MDGECPADDEQLWCASVPSAQRSQVLFSNGSKIADTNHVTCVHRESLPPIKCTICAWTMWVPGAWLSSLLGLCQVALRVAARP